MCKNGTHSTVTLYMSDTKNFGFMIIMIPIMIIMREEDNIFKSIFYGWYILT